ncbi:DNA repair protein RAD50 [Trichodelitschia bisporula]|uniref:DNA repair protein RAD50 n=1 Tax=Trichodelitschia bisporula TaxID=703511 RepID=A0A6G1I118_9PEZI|nr:DNA repair protein RAD50 [Trichodelitschia bisporula]
MSKIDKLLIENVRSFSSPQVIQFYSPLTLIVGYNGAGKTTIIEALRYATTGELPPNSTAGGAWIHDPKLAGENEVKAQVKLQFTSTSGEKIITSRHVQLTVKNKTRSQKTLDATVSITTTGGEKSTYTTRVLDLDKLMPERLGVSKAILESVIFCHQDDSLWPMAQPAQLKKKFDEIFEAMKYTKAVENIKIIKKKQMDDLSNYKLQEQHAKENKDRGAKAERKSELLYEEMEALRAKEEELRAKIKEAAQKSQDAWDHAAKFEKIVTELAGKRIQAEAAEKTIRTLKQHMHEMEDSDEELRSMQEQYEERLAFHHDEIEKLRKSYEGHQYSLERCRKRLGELQSLIGQYKAEKEEYERQLASREELIRDLARRHGIRGFETTAIRDTHVLDFMEKIDRLAREQNNALEQLRREAHEEYRKAQDALNRLSERRSVLTQSKSGAGQIIRGNDHKIGQFQAALDKIDIDEGSQAAFESSIVELERKLVAAKSEQESAQFDAQIRTAEGKLRTLDDEKDACDSELIEAMRRAQDSARLDFLRKELKDRERSLETMTGAHGDRISKVVGRSWTPATLETVYQDALGERVSAVKEAEVQRDGVSRELEQVQFKLRNASSDLKEKERDLKVHKMRVSEVVGDDGSTYPEFLEEAESSYNLLKHDNTSYESMKDYYKQALKVAEDSNACRLCYRPFKARGDEAKTKFLQRLNQLIEQAAETTRRDDLQSAEETFTEAKKVRSDYDAFVRLEKEVPELTKDCERLQALSEGLVSKLEDHDANIKELLDVKRDVDSLLKTVQSIAKYNTEIGSFQSQIQDLARTQGTDNQMRSIEDIQTDQRQATEKIRAINASLQQLRTDRERAQRALNSLELEVRDTRSRLSVIIGQLKERDNFQQQIEDLKVQSAKQREEIKQADLEIQSVLPQIAQAQASLEETRRVGEEREREKLAEVSKLSESLHQLRLASRAIDAYIERGGPEQLQRSIQDNREQEKVYPKIEEMMKTTTRAIKQVEDDIRNRSDTQRAITDNLTYRENLQNLETLRAEMAELEAYNAEADKERYEREAGRWQVERNKLSADQATIVGSLKSKDDQLQQLLQEWETDYKDAAYKYREAHIRVLVTRAAVDDLGRYGGALDKAIMRYHSMKMEEINRIIDELWRNTYQGTDVDTIMIRSENETQKGNKSYNYRVVMIKQDAEMDMRGRCSAGQKVLASIIIRLALAECFGVRCGLIALDEPTTNLDRDNIRALASSLSQIIEIRKQQANFQLIVITHDEEFLRFMNCSDVADYYYRVSRNQNQKSEIKRQDIQAVME